MPAIRRNFCLGVLFFLATGCGPGGAPGGGGANIAPDGGISVAVGNNTFVTGSGQVAEQQRDVAGFRNVAAQSSIQVSIAITGEESANVEADDNVLPLIETKVEGDTLHIRAIGSFSTRNPIRVSVTAKQLSGLTASSSATIQSPQLEGDQVTIDANSSGQITVEKAQADQMTLTASSSAQITIATIESKTLNVNANSSGGVTAAGNADQQQIEVSSSGTYDGGKLASRSARVNANSSGSAEIQVTEELTGSATSSGTVRYLGNPAKVSVEINSSGSVSKDG